MSHVFFDGTQLRKDIATLFEAAGLNKAGAACSFSQLSRLL